VELIRESEAAAAPTAAIMAVLAGAMLVPLLAVAMVVMTAASKMSTLVRALGLLLLLLLLSAISVSIVLFLSLQADRSGQFGQRAFDLMSWTSMRFVVSLARAWVDGRSGLVGRWGHGPCSCVGSLPVALALLWNEGVNLSCWCLVESDGEDAKVRRSGGLCKGSRRGSPVSS